MVGIADITICLPVFERTQFFKNALESAVACQAKILVLDNASSHSEFEDFARDSQGQVKYFRNPRNLGFIGNWNRCLELAETDWVSILHDDDALLPESMIELIRAANSLPGRGLYFGLENIMDENGSISRVASESSGSLREIQPLEYALENQFLAAGFIMDRKLALSLGGFSENRRVSPDWDLYFRICRARGAVRINSAVANYRQYFYANRITSKLEVSGRFFIGVSGQLRKNIRLLPESPPDDDLKEANARIAGLAQAMLLKYGFLIPKKMRKIHFKFAMEAPVRFSKHLFVLRWLPRCLAIFLLCFYSSIRRGVFRKFT